MVNPYKGFVVGVDGGHGIDTAGKRSPDGKFREYKWNREVADLLCTYLCEDGIDARILVPETNDIALTTRANRMNRICRRLEWTSVSLSPYIPMHPATSGTLHPVGNAGLL